MDPYSYDSKRSNKILPLKFYQFSPTKDRVIRKSDSVFKTNQRIMVTELKVEFTI